MATGIGPVNGILVWTEAARFQALRDFYADTLGLEPRADRAGHVNFEWGGLRLTIAVHDTVGGPARDPLRLMINYAVEDIEAEHARLLRRRRRLHPAARTRAVGRPRRHVRRPGRQHPAAAAAAGRTLAVRPSCRRR